MAGYFDHVRVQIPCPGCGAIAVRDIGWVRAHDAFTCTCGKRVALRTARFRRELRRLERAFDAVARSARRKPP